MSNAAGYRLPIGIVDPDQISHRFLRGIRDAAKRRGHRPVVRLAELALQGDADSLRRLRPTIEATRERAAREGTIGVLS